MAIGRADALKPHEARNQAKSILGKAYLGQDPAAVAAKSHTFGSFIDEEYTPWAKAHIRTHSGTLRRLNTSFAAFRELRLSEITPLLVDRWRTERLGKGAKPSTVNRDLDDLKSSVGKAKEWGFIGEHPLVGVKRSRIDDRAKVRFLSDMELTSLLRALDQREEDVRQRRDRFNEWRKSRGRPLLPDLRVITFADHLKPMVLISLHTGVRYGELANLTWGDVDFERPFLTVQGIKAKSLRTRHIPLNSIALTVFREWKAQCPDGRCLVFANRDGDPFDNVRTSWETVLRLAEITDFRWHDLRHSFASHLVMKGVDISTVRDLLGHADYQMTLRYAHLAPEHKAAAVAKLVDKVLI
jgi:integrase